MSRFVAATDQETTDTRSMVFDRSGRPRGNAYRKHEQHYPKPGWVERDAREIWENTKATLLAALDDAGVDATDLAAIGVTNQRETAVVWECETGEPVHNAIV